MKSRKRHGCSHSPHPRNTLPLRTVSSQMRAIHGLSCPAPARLTQRFRLPLLLLPQPPVKGKMTGETTGLCAPSRSPPRRWNTLTSIQCEPAWSNAPRTGCGRVYLITLGVSATRSVHIACCPLIEHCCRGMKRREIERRAAESLESETLRYFGDGRGGLPKTSRTLRASASGEKGFCRNAPPESSPA